MNKQLRNDTALPTHFMTEEQQALADQAGKFFMSEFHHLNAEMDDTDDLPTSVFPMTICASTISTATPMTNCAASTCRGFATER